MRINLPRKRHYAAQQKHKRKRPSIVGSPNVRNRAFAGNVPPTSSFAPPIRAADATQKTIRGTQRMYA